MAKDSIVDRFRRRLEKTKLSDRARSTRDKTELEAEEEMIANTEKVKPIKAEGETGRNDPCPCGSGKKYKKCCGAKDGAS